MDLVEALNYAVAFFTLLVVNVFILLYARHRNDYKEPEKTGYEPHVSIIIPAYNESAYIGTCLKSVLAVDYPAGKLDIIVVDDGSKDDTYKIAVKMADELAGGSAGEAAGGFASGNGKVRGATSPSVRVFTKPNGGKGSALNFGLARAKGELVATMDADSYITPGVIRALVPYFAADPEVMAVTPAIKVKESGAWLKEFQRVEYLMILFSRKLLSFIDSVPVTPGPFSLFRAGVFREIGGFSEDNLVEDQEIALRIQAHHHKIRSSMAAEVFTEPPDNLRDLLKQRIRWQRGGFRNYWDYKYLMNPAYGDFGMYFVPLNFATITAFFLLLGLMAHSFFATPYYVRYIWFDAFGMTMGLFTFIGAFVFITSTVFLYLSVASFPEERVKLRYILLFMLFYWFLSVGYNTLFVLKEIRREPAKW